MAAVVIVLVVVMIGVIVTVMFFKKCVYVVPPNKVMVLSGRANRLPNGQMVAYRAITHGRAMRFPFIETAEWLDLSNMVVDVEVSSAHTSGGGPADLSSIANIRISSSPNLLHKAVERFLGQQKDQIKMVARETMEGVIRQTLSRSTDEELSGDTAPLTRKLEAEAEMALNKLGLELDSIKIRNLQVQGGAGAPPTAAPVTTSSDKGSPTAASAQEPQPSQPLDELKTLKKLKELTDKTLSSAQRDALLAKLEGRTVPLDLQVQSVALTTEMDLPEPHRRGQTLTGKTPWGLEVQAHYPASRSDEAQALRPGNTVSLNLEIRKWNSLFSRLSALVV